MTHIYTALTCCEIALKTSEVDILLDPCSSVLMQEDSLEFCATEIFQDIIYESSDEISLREAAGELFLSIARRISSSICTCPDTTENDVSRNLTTCLVRLSRLTQILKEVSKPCDIKRKNEKLWRLYDEFQHEAFILHRHLLQDRDVFTTSESQFVVSVSMQSMVEFVEFYDNTKEAIFLWKTFIEKLINGSSSISHQDLSGLLIIALGQNLRMVLLDKSDLWITVFFDIHLKLCAKLNFDTDGITPEKMRSIAKKFDVNCSGNCKIMDTTSDTFMSEMKTKKLNVKFDWDNGNSVEISSLQKINLSAYLNATHSFEQLTDLVVNSLQNLPASFSEFLDMIPSCIEEKPTPDPMATDFESTTRSTNEISLNPIPCLTSENIFKNTVAENFSNYSEIASKGFSGLGNYSGENLAEIKRLANPLKNLLFSSLLPVKSDPHRELETSTSYTTGKSRLGLKILSDILYNKNSRANHQTKIAMLKTYLTHFLGHLPFSSCVMLSKRILPDSVLQEPHPAFSIDLFVTPLMYLLQSSYVTIVNGLSQENNSEGPLPLALMHERLEGISSPRFEIFDVPDFICEAPKDPETLDIIDTSSLKDLKYSELFSIVVNQIFDLYLFHTESQNKSNPAYDNQQIVAMRRNLSVALVRVYSQAYWIPCKGFATLFYLATNEDPLFRKFFNPIVAHLLRNSTRPYVRRTLGQMLMRLAVCSDSVIRNETLTFIHHRLLGGAPPSSVGKITGGIGSDTEAQLALFSVLVLHTLVDNDAVRTASERWNCSKELVALAISCGADWKGKDTSNKKAGDTSKAEVERKSLLLGLCCLRYPAYIVALSSVHSLASPDVREELRNMAQSTLPWLATEFYKKPTSEDSVTTPEFSKAMVDFVNSITPQSESLLYTVIDSLPNFHDVWWYPTKQQMIFHEEVGQKCYELSGGILLPRGVLESLKQKIKEISSNKLGISCLPFLRKKEIFDELNRQLYAPPAAINCMKDGVRNLLTFASKFPFEDKKQELVNKCKISITTAIFLFVCYLCIFVF
eukprot:GHVP01042293.1.p1 GENE.GHVP01042293.1~~GHVP01042293.1.p1  ORF type:complete len:1030 (-),score=182.11 GHVP01042293.1:823-3912(-)